ncbi:uncharacterized protein LOC112128397 [Cimex lectularius]|uniref:Uncharacterized protein n=1 Tax=Cimex lectularius TaxID=79782 RepID=A0A8I6SVF5_CIMLE|nr:uncharacterized protein LOC112128397 [Cimex lectularius]
MNRLTTGLKGATLLPMGPEPQLGARTVCLSWNQKNEMRNKSSNTPGMRQDLRIIGPYTIHYHLKKKGKTETETRWLWQDDPETSAHILCECKALNRLRYSHLGRTFLISKEIHKAPRKGLSCIRAHFSRYGYKL